MNRILFFFCLVCCPTVYGVPALGVDRAGEFSAYFSGKRLALVVNQASVTSAGEHTIDSLRARGFNIVKLFALEHGVRGGGGAGEELPDSRDEVTGLPIVSLYGKHKKPTAAMLADVDAIVYDVQDVGVRFYTYISSLGLIMEGAAENGKRVIVLDRPNPNGDYIGGPVLKDGNYSFVGAFPIPVVYGMTAGELARMIHGKGWKKTAGLELRIVPMEGYARADRYEPRVFPSPGLRNYKAIRVYPSGALLEPTVMSFGGGTAFPYLQYGFPDTKMGVHEFTPLSQRPGHHPRYEGQVCYGERFYETEDARLPLFTTDIFTRALKKFGGKGFVTEPRFLELLVGDVVVVRRMLAGEPYSKIETSLAAELKSFREQRKKYLLYQ